MAFVKKTWKDRIAEFPTRRRLTKEDNTSELVTVAREEGTLSQEGDAFSAENMNDLENRIDAEFTEVNGKLQNGNCGSPKIFDLNETYICPNNGYVHIRNTTNQMGYISMYSSNNIQIGTLRPITTIGDTTAEISCFIRKGTKLQTGGVAFNYCQYIPLDE